MGHFGGIWGQIWKIALGNQIIVKIKLLMPAYQNRSFGVTQGQKTSEDRQKTRGNFRNFIKSS